jgi:hypothetical protein
MWRLFTSRKRRIGARSVIITDVTRMKPPRVCIAGYFESDLKPVRPTILFEGIKEEFLYQEGELIIKPFSIVEFRFLRHEPDPPHTEDWVIDPNYKRLVGRIEVEERIDFLEKIKDQCIEKIFGADIYHAEEGGYYVKKGEGARSLGTIIPCQISYISYRELEQAKWDYRITLVDQCGKEYRLPITDLEFRKHCDHRRVIGEHPDKIALGLKERFNRCKLYLRIGLARGWERFPERCYLQITALYSFPDYLEEKDFNDFSKVMKDDEVPF